MISYNPRAAMTIPEWPNCIALEPGGIHARRAYRNNLDLIALMVSITEIEAEEVRFVCPIFFVIRPRETDYLCYGQFRYPVDHASVSYEDKRVIIADGSIIDTGDIANFDFYLMAFYRCRVWLDIGST
jgi:hypothetical protein